MKRAAPLSAASAAPGGGRRRRTGRRRARRRRGAARGWRKSRVPRVLPLACGSSAGARGLACSPSRKRARRPSPGSPRGFGPGLLYENGEREREREKVREKEGVSSFFFQARERARSVECSFFLSVAPTRPRDGSSLQTLLLIARQQIRERERGEPARTVPAASRVHLASTQSGRGRRTPFFVFNARIVRSNCALKKQKKVFEREKSSVLSPSLEFIVDYRHRRRQALLF